MTRVLVCGGRDYQDRAAMAVTLMRFANGNHVIIHGGAPGADTLAGEWEAA